MDSYIIADGYELWVPEKALSISLNQTINDCNSIPAMLSDTDSIALLNETSHFVFLFQLTAQSLINKKPVIDSVPLGDSFSASPFIYFSKDFKSLNACFSAHIPLNMSATVQNYFNQLDSICTDVCTSFNITC